MWIYDFALQVFEARWKNYLGYRDLIAPVPPDLPEMKCSSTVKTFICENAEFMGSFEYNQQTKIKEIFQ